MEKVGPLPLFLLDRVRKRLSPRSAAFTPLPEHVYVRHTVNGETRYVSHLGVGEIPTALHVDYDTSVPLPTIVMPRRVFYGDDRLDSPKGISLGLVNLADDVWKRLLLGCPVEDIVRDYISVNGDASPGASYYRDKRLSPKPTKLSRFRIIEKSH